MVEKILDSVQMALACRMDERSFAIIVLWVDREAELADEEFTDVGATSDRREVEGGALVGVAHGGGDGGGARAVLVERRDEVLEGLEPLV